MPDGDVTGAEPVEPGRAADETVAPAVEERFSIDEPLAIPLVSERLLGARDLALAALHEITPAASVGPAAGYLPEVDGVVSLRFENRLGGYPGWYWTVSVAQVGDEEPTVLEAELMPGDGALLAPEWVPWAERLADYRAHQAELAASAQNDAEASGSDGLPGEELVEGTGDLDEDDLDEDELDEDELDDDELDDEAAPRLHAGDLDGVDIDELDDSAEDDSDDEDSDDEDDDSEEE
ncbi:DUF3027 domain-containing protein [Microbacterium sp. NPDC056052]|uniref:DUF3027 domain-containing protein n=1 Tax=Microbacterium sp. NPDC056052 TaxID=3345695 RepID=UPI0035DCCE2D